jgi:protein SCO1/2
MRTATAARTALALSVVTGLLLATGCGPDTATPPPEPDQAEIPGLRTFEVRGVFKRLEDEGRTIVVYHEEIPGFMMAMTMPIPLKNPADAEDLEPGDQILFRLCVTEDSDWMDRIRKTGEKVDLDTLPKDDPAEWVDVEVLGPGDLLPDQTFTNHLGEVMQLSDFRGRALAFTFFFTRCPLPTYCPQMSRFFAEAQKQLLADSTGPTNWQLLCLSFDPAFDNTSVLRGYAGAYGCDTNHWLFGTAGEEEIEAFGRQFDLTLVREDASISHNLRTVVADPEGRIQTVFTNNLWQPEDLVQAIRKAAAEKPSER